MKLLLPKSLTDYRQSKRFLQMKKYLFFTTISVFAIILPLNSSTREEYIFKKNSLWTPSGLDTHWSIDLTNWANYFLKRDQNTFFSSGKGYTTKRFESECGHIKNQYQWNRCRDVEVLFLMDKLSQYYNREKIYKTDNENFYSNAYFSLREVIDITDKTTKNCQNNHLKDRSLDHYPKFVSDCVIESLKSKLR